MTLKPPHQNVIKTTTLNVNTYIANTYGANTYV